MIKSHAEKDELDSDTQQGRWSEPKPSIFDWMDEPETECTCIPDRVGRYMMVDGKETFVPREDLVQSSTFQLLDTEREEG